MPAKVKINTRRAVEVKHSQIICRGPRDLHFVHEVWYWRWVGLFVATGPLFGFTKLILHRPRAVTAASRGSTIADFALTTTCQLEPYIPWSRLTHILPCHTLIPIVWALVCAITPPIRSQTKRCAILNESLTAVTASRFSPWFWGLHFVWSDTDAFWGFNFEYLHSGGFFFWKSQHWWLLGVAFWVLCNLGSHFGESRHQ